MRELEAAADNRRHMARMLQRFDELLMELSGHPALMLVSQMAHHIINLHIASIPESSRELPAPNVADIKRGRREPRRVIELLKEGRGAEVEALMRKIFKRMEAHHARIMEAAGCQLQII